MAGRPYIETSEPVASGQKADGTDVSEQLWMSAQPSSAELKACSPGKPDQIISQPPPVDSNGKKINTVVSAGKVEVSGNGRATLKGNTVADLHGTGFVNATENSVVCARDKTWPSLLNNSTGYLSGNAGGFADDNANVYARGRRDVHFLSDGHVSATDQKWVYLRSGTGYISGHAAAWVGGMKGAPVAYGKDNAVLVTYRTEPEDRGIVAGLKDKALWLDYKADQHTLTINNADGTSRTVPAPEGGTIWVRDDEAAKTNHKVASGDDIVVTVRTKKQNFTCDSPPAKITGDALWIDLWQPGSPVEFIHSYDVCSPMEIARQRINYAPGIHFLRQQFGKVKSELKKIP